MRTLMALVAAGALSGCAGLDVGSFQERAGQYAGKYCDLSSETRLAIRKSVNAKLPEGVTCAVVQCQGDAPVACPFLPEQ